MPMLHQGTVEQSAAADKCLQVVPPKHPPPRPAAPLTPASASPQPAWCSSSRCRAKPTSGRPWSRHHKRPAGTTRCGWLCTAMPPPAWRGLQRSAGMGGGGMERDSIEQQRQNEGAAHQEHSTGQGPGDDQPAPRCGWRAAAACRPPRPHGSSATHNQLVPRTLVVGGVEEQIARQRHILGVGLRVLACRKEAGGKGR